MKNFDIVVIGAGPGGYVAAIRAAQLGMKTAIVEKEHLGGICLNWGCIPTKALLASASALDYAKRAAEFGVELQGTPKANLEAMVKRSRKVSSQLTSGVAGLLKKHKVEVIEGAAKLQNNTNIEVVKKDNTKEVITAKHIILATGARARILPNLEPDGKLIWTYKEALQPTRIPKKLVVIGSGAIGIEFAYFYHSIGSEVTVIEMKNQIMPTEDKEIADLAQKIFTKKGIKILTSVTMQKVEKLNDSVKVTITDANQQQQILEGDTLISAVGIVPNVENLGLENTKIKLENGRPVVDKWSQTSEPTIYAIGDLANGPWLAHKASHEGVIVVEKIAGTKDLHSLNYKLIPGCIYTHPQIASIGIKEEDAKKQGLNVKVGKFPLIANGKAIALGDPEGLIKVIFDTKTGELLGAHMIGPEVTELIQGYVTAMNLETTEQELMHSIFAHPTLSEAMHEAVLAAYGKAIHY